MKTTILMLILGFLALGAIPSRPVPLLAPVSQRMRRR